MPKEYGYADMIDNLNHTMILRHMAGRERELIDLQASGAPEYRILECQVKVAWCLYVLETRGLVSRLPQN